MTNGTPGTKGFQCVPVEERFWQKVDIRSSRECWPWKGATDVSGRGDFWRDGVKQKAPRVAWSLRYGVPFPKELHACHTCDNPACCNPEHLWPGTRTQNFMDAARKGRLHVSNNSPAAILNRTRTHCKRGHAFDAANTYITKIGGRKCRACCDLQRLKYLAAHRDRALSPLDGEA